MAQVTGIRFEKDSIGRRTHVRIDLRKFGNAITPFLEEIGAIDDDEFQRDRQRALSAAEFKQEMFNRIDAWPKTAAMYFTHS